MTFTIEQRIDIYNEAVTWLKEDAQSYICRIIGKIAYNDRNHFYFWRHALERDFPEIYQQKPIGINQNDSWFPSGDVQSRINLLNKAIEICQSKL